MRCAKSCGVCPSCIDGELWLLIEIERHIWEDAEGDQDTYVYNMDEFNEWFNERGGVL